MLLLTTNRKLYTRFRLASKALILIDLERQYSGFIAFSCDFGSRHKF